MFKYALLIVIVVMPLLGEAFLLSAQENSSPPANKQQEQALKYKASDGIPQDKAAEKLRDYAVLEACLNDLASSKNPEHKYHIQNVGAGREIVIDDGTCKYNLFIDLGQPSHNIDNKDTRRIPADIQEDFKPRNAEPAGSLADFKPANPNIILMDLDGFFDKSDDPIRDFLIR
jgi:hypothetical protein